MPENMPVTGVIAIDPRGDEDQLDEFLLDITRTYKVTVHLLDETAPDGRPQVQLYGEDAEMIAAAVTALTSPPATPVPSEEAES